MFSVEVNLRTRVYMYVSVQNISQQDVRSALLGNETPHIFLFLFVLKHLQGERGYFPYVLINAVYLTTAI